MSSHLHFGKELLDKFQEYGDLPALINADTDETLTYSGLAQKTVDIALSLARIGVRKGQVVSICSDKRMEVLPTILGVLCAGGVYTPTENQPLIHRLELSRPKVMFMSSNTFNLHKTLFDTVGCIEKYIIFDEECAQNDKQNQDSCEIKNGDENRDGLENKHGDENRDGLKNKHGAQNQDGVLSFKDFLTETAKVSEFIPTPVEGWRDWAFILFSSGTTGLPKGVPWTHMGILINSISYIHDRYINSSILLTREWFLSYGLAVTLGCLRKGLACVYSVRNLEADCLAAIQTYKIKLIQSAPTSINQLIKSAILDRYDVTSVETLLSSSMPVGKEQVEAVKKRLPNLKQVYQLYGTSEAGAVCNEMYAALGTRDGSCGTPSHGNVFKVVDLNSREPLGPNERGEICFKSLALTPGYIGIHDHDYLDSEGFYKSGDVGYYDTDGYFYVVNRIKELIKYKDYSIAPAEIEAILCEHSQVRESGVTAVDGEIAAAVVLSAGGRVTTEELVHYFHTVAPPRFRLEGGVHFVQRLPRGAGDKLDRGALLVLLEDCLKNKHKSLLPNLRAAFQTYGTSEAGAVCDEMYASPGSRLGSCGPPSYGVVIKVVDYNTREPLGPNQRGEICFKSPALTPGYIGVNNTDYLDSEGFYKSGDVGYYDTDGCYYIVSRIKELIKLKDYSIPPAELEAILCQNGQVREAGVAAVGGVLAALVVVNLDGGVTAAEVEEFYHNVAPPRFRLEGGVHFVQRLPRGAGDKLDRGALLVMMERVVL